MGVLKSLRRRRRDRKLAKKIAKRTAKQRVRSDAKLQNKKEKFLNKRAKKVLKEDKKAAKQARKHEQQLATAAVKRAQQQGFHPKRALQAASAVRVIAPLAVPLVYKGLTLLQGRTQATYAQQLGVSKEALSIFKGEGAPMKSRIETIRASLETTPDGFRIDMDKRLKQLRKAIDTAERLPETQRKAAFSQIARELDEIAQKVSQKSS